MVGVRLSITDEAGVTDNREMFFVVRWMIDPNLGLDTLPASTGTTGSTGSSSSGGASGSAGGTQ
jgi:hypothetical protein